MWVTLLIFNNKLICFCADTVASVEMSTLGPQTTQRTSESQTHDVSCMKFCPFVISLLIKYIICGINYSSGTVACIIITIMVSH